LIWCIYIGHLWVRAGCADRYKRSTEVLQVTYGTKWNENILWEITCKKTSRCACTHAHTVILSTLDGLCEGRVFQVFEGWLLMSWWKELIRWSASVDRNIPVHTSFWYAVMWTVDGWWQMLTNSMEQSPSWKINSWWTQSQNSLNFLEPKGTSSCSQKPAICLF
jgi:hypothetical protein